MDSREEEEGVVVVGVMKRAEIDTRAPFQSVKEAVMLFGERVLATEVYANQLKQMKAASSENGNGTSRIGSVTAELQETKQILEKARKEGALMANCLQTLQQELELTKREVLQLKAREFEKQRLDYETDDDVKFIEPSITTPIIQEFEKKRYVNFASPPSLAQVISPEYSQHVLERHPSLKKKKKKALLPTIGGFFTKKKAGNQGVVSSNKVRAS